MGLLQWSWSWNPRPKIHFTIALIVTIAATILSIVSLLYSYRQITQNPIVEGIVINSIGGVDVLHTPIIEYNSPTKGRTHFKSRLSSSPQKYFVGDKVKVILIGQDYKPKLKSFLTVYGLSTFLVLFTSIFAIGTTAVYNFRVKK